MTLIHTALFAEAKSIIEHFKLECLQTKPFRIYKKDNIILITSGMGRKKTTLHVKDIFESYEIQKALNIGMAGCKDTSVKIGELFCTTHKLADIKHTDITTVDEPLENDSKLKTTLVDMEADAFISTCKEYIDKKDIYVFKVVSDHLNTTIPKKEFVWEIIKKNLKAIEKTVTSTN